MNPPTKCYLNHQKPMTPCAWSRLAIRAAHGLLEVGSASNGVWTSDGYSKSTTGGAVAFVYVDPSGRPLAPPTGPRVMIQGQVAYPAPPPPGYAPPAVYQPGPPPAGAPPQQPAPASYAPPPPAAQ